ncbi:MAG: ATP-binding cassette domain-containing protein [Ignavibacteriaceae bacterium]
MLDVKIKNINLKERGTLLSEINFSLELGKISTILGPNGTGKSTLIKSLTGLLDSRFYSIEGSVVFDKEDILSLNYPSLLDIRRNKIKYVFQDSINSFDHLMKFDYYFRRIAKDIPEADDLLEYFILPSPQKLFSLYPYEVSGGMAQRISFVLALLAHPQIIILDEPTSGIDSAISNLFLIKLKEFVTQNNHLNGGHDHSALLVTHDIMYAQKISDKIAFISEGKLSSFVDTQKFFEAGIDQSLNKYLTAGNSLWE